jgi:hypothetical protein
MQRGDPIPGSHYVRDFCAECGAEIRVSRANLTTRGGTPNPNYCADCKSYLRPTGPAPEDDDEDLEAEGEWDNAVRALEDADASM